MRKFERWLIGLTCAITLCENNLRSVTFAHVCELKENPSHQKTAECTDKNLEIVPDDLPADIQNLSLSNNYRFSLGENTFKKYSDLVEIRLENLKNKSDTEPVAHVNTFFSLKKLEIVHMGYSGYDTEFNWPENVRELYLQGHPFLKVNIENLPNLEIMNLTGCNLSNFPKPHKSAVIETLIAENNPLGNLTAERLSHYCTSSWAGLKSKQPKNVLKAHFCRCVKIKKWLAMIATNVTGNFLCDPGKKESDCPANTFDFSELESNQKNCLEVLKTREAAREAARAAILSNSNSTSQPPSPLFPSWLLYIIIVVGIAILLFIILGIYYMLTRSPPESEIEEVEDYAEVSESEEPAEPAVEEEE